MISDDNELDPALRRALMTLSRNASPSLAFTDRVVHDLERRGLVGESSVRSTMRWLAAAGIFALGIGIGAALAGVRTAPAATPQPTSRQAVHRLADVNVPPVGHSEVWF